MAEKRRALGRGLGALIPSAPSGSGGRPVDVFFKERVGEGLAPSHGVSPAGEPVSGPAGDYDAPPRPAPEASTGHEAELLERQSGTVPDPTCEQAMAGPAEQDPEHVADQDPEQDAEPDMWPDTHTVTHHQDLAPVPGAEFAELDILAIRPNPKQPRTVFDTDELAELAHSIKEIGVLQPVVVRRIPADELADAGGKRYELIMGERRWRASQEAGQPTIPAIIKDTHDDDLLRDALLENLHRSQLNSLEEAAAYQQLLDDFGCSHEVLATRIGRSRPQISNTLRLLKLPPLVQRRLAAGVLSAGHARALLGLADGAAMERMAQRIVAEGLSVRTVEELVSLGDGNEAPRARRPRAGDRHPQLDDVAATLADRLETRVNIALGQRKGKITVEFASVEDLKRIVGLMGLEAELDAAS